MPSSGTPSATYIKTTTPVAHVDAIIVPTVRPSNCLAHAIKLAQEAESYIVALCSGGIASSEASYAMSCANVRGVAVDIPAHYSHSLLADFATDAFPEALFCRSNNDVSLKRNLGLLLSRLLSWDKVFFFDDDLVGIGGKELAQTVASLDGTVAGFLAIDFPDNSVIRHAERLSGKDPMVYMSVGALGVNTRKAVGFFPNIYNEDWFFLYDNLPTARIVGTIKQQPYDPFSSPLRAVAEEFGDLLGEGIMQLRDMGLDCVTASEDDWRNIVTCRRDFIREIRQNLANVTAATKEAALASLSAAENRLNGLDASLCVRYIRAWRNDIELWQRRLDEQPTHLSLPAIIEMLHLEGQFVEKQF